VLIKVNKMVDKVDKIFVVFALSFTKKFAKKLANVDLYPDLTKI